MSARRARRAEPATLGAEQIRDLHVRILRGRPRTTEEIRAIAPPGLDLSRALEALEEQGLIAVGRDGLDIADPRRVLGELARAGLATRQHAWESAAEASRELSALAQAWRESAQVDTAVAGSVSVGDSEEWWRHVLAIPGDLGIAVRGSAVGDVPLALLDGRTRAWRLLVERGALAEPVAGPAVRAAAQRGVDVRIARTVPGWLAVGESIALALRWAENTPSGVTTTSDASIVAALSWVFDDLWRAAVSLHEVDVFTLMAMGCDDSEVAAALDLSIRTVQRRIGYAMDAIGARSRFELGAAWARSPAIVAGDSTA